MSNYYQNDDENLTKRNRRQKKKGDNWQQELKEIISGASGGFIFGMPLLYTMEVWFIGSYVKSFVLLTILVIMFLIILLINRIEGFRPQESETFSGALAESLETLAIGITCATFMLIILKRIDLDSSLVEALGKIVFEGVPFSIGVAFSRSILSGEAKVDLDNRKTRNSSRTQNSNNHQLIWRDTLADFSATLIGALFIAFSIAPTDEVTVLAASASPFRLLVIMFISILISYAIVFASEFTNYDKRRQQQGLFQAPLSETFLSYIVSLITGILMLWFFQKLTFSDPWFVWLRYGIILALPASIGGAAGRLAV